MIPSRSVRSCRSMVAAFSWIARHSEAGTRASALARLSESRARLITRSPTPRINSIEPLKLHPNVMGRRGPLDLCGGRSVVRRRVQDGCGRRASPMRSTRRVQLTKAFQTDDVGRGDDEHELDAAVFADVRDRLENRSMLGNAPSNEVHTD